MTDDTLNSGASVPSCSLTFQVKNVISIEIGPIYHRLMTTRTWKKAPRKALIVSVLSPTQESIYEVSCCDRVVTGGIGSCTNLYERSDTVFRRIFAAECGTVNAVEAQGIDPELQTLTKLPPRMERLGWLVMSG